MLAAPLSFRCTLKVQHSHTKFIQTTTLVVSAKVKSRTTYLQLDRRAKGAVVESGGKRT